MTRSLLPLITIVISSILVSAEAETLEERRQAEARKNAAAMLLGENDGSAQSTEDEYNDLHHRIQKLNEEILRSSLDIKNIAAVPFSKATTALSNARLAKLKNDYPTALANLKESQEFFMKAKQEATDFWVEEYSRMAKKSQDEKNIKKAIGFAEKALALDPDNKEMTSFMTQLSALSRKVDRTKIPRGFLGRAPVNRTRSLQRYGRTQTEQTVIRALRWLKEQQQRDGSWEGCPPASTGFALLTFFAHGDTIDSPEFGETIDKAIRWLMENQNPNGTFKNKDANNYSQSIAAAALCEAFALTGNNDVKVAAEKALRPIIDGFHPGGMWDYNFRQNGRNDTSFSGWAIQALFCAKMAGIRVEGLDKIWPLVPTGLMINYDKNYGGFGYTSPSHSGMSGVGAFCLQISGAKNNPAVSKTMQMLSAAEYGWDRYDGPQPYTLTNGQSPLYFWYYITNAKFQAGDDVFSKWERQFAEELMKRQIVEKIAKQLESGKTIPMEIGYWDSPSSAEHGSGGGMSLGCKRWHRGSDLSGTTYMGNRIQDTCLCALQLMVYYRYPRM